MYKRLLASLICLTFSISNLQYVQAQDFSVDQLPVPGTIVGISTPFSPLTLKGLIVNPQKPLEFQFIVDTGRGPQDPATVKDQANQLVKYFLAGLTIPEGDLWVNLSPYEKNRMVPEALGQTDLGRDLLAQDYILKQLTASLIYPEKDLGKEFWSRVYAKAQEQLGTTNIPVNTFNKVWILPDQAQVFENTNAAYVTKSSLKVMLDEDYLAKQKHQGTKASSISSQILRQIILPEIEKEVNTGKNFALLRQIYQALILAKWYKETIQNGLLDAVYNNKNKIAGVNLNDPTIKEQIYQRYLDAYKKGAFNYIKDTPAPDGQIAPRKYFSGGEVMVINLDKRGSVNDIAPSDGAMLSMDVNLEETKDAAMLQSPGKEEFNPYSTANDILTKASLSGQKVDHKRVRFLGDALALVRSMIDLQRDVPKDEIIQKMRELNITQSYFLQALNYFFTSDIERDKVRASSLIYNLYLGSNNASERDNLRPTFKTAAKVIDRLNAVQGEGQDDAMLARVKISFWSLTDNVDKIASMLSHKSEGVRRFAEKALIRLGATKERMSDAYIAVLKTGGPEARIYAVKKLADSGGIRAIGPLASLMRKAEKNERHEEYNLISDQLNRMRALEGDYIYKYHGWDEIRVGDNLPYWEKVKRSQQVPLQPLNHSIVPLDQFRLVTQDIKAGTQLFSITIPATPQQALGKDGENPLGLLNLDSKINHRVLKMGLVIAGSNWSSGGHDWYNNIDHLSPQVRWMNLTVVLKTPFSEGKMMFDEPVSVVEAKVTLLNQQHHPLLVKETHVLTLTKLPTDRQIREEIIKMDPSANMDDISNVIAYFHDNPRPLPDIVNYFLRIRRDSAMLNKGGIDLNQINVKRNGRTVSVQFDQAQLSELVQGGFTGFIPVIISMTPIKSPLPLLGIGSADISK